MSGRLLRTNSGYVQSHELDNKWTTESGLLIPLDDEEDYEDPFINHYSDEESDSFYEMTDGMEGDL